MQQFLHSFEKGAYFDTFAPYFEKGLGALFAKSDVNLDEVQTALNTLLDTYGVSSALNPLNSTSTTSENATAEILHRLGQLCNVFVLKFSVRYDF